MNIRIFSDTDTITLTFIQYLFIYQVNDLRHMLKHFVFLQPFWVTELER